MASRTGCRRTLVTIHSGFSGKQRAELQWRSTLPLKFGCTAQDRQSYSTAIGDCSSPIVRRRKTGSAAHPSFSHVVKPFCRGYSYPTMEKTRRQQERHEKSMSARLPGGRSACAACHSPLATPARFSPSGASRPCPWPFPRPTSPGTREHPGSHAALFDWTAEGFPRSLRDILLYRSPIRRRYAPLRTSVSC